MKWKALPMQKMSIKNNTEHDTARERDDEHMNRLYCIPGLQQIENYLAFADAYQMNFEYNDFFLPAVLDDDMEKERMIKKYLALGRDCSQDTMHGAFLDLCIDSSDSRIFQVSDLRIRQSMEIAERMGLRAVIFHTNYIVNFRLQSYLDTWLLRNEAYWRQILREYPGQEIFLENMFDDTPQLLQKLAERMADEPRFAVCLDTAHAMISGSPLRPWLEGLQPYISHIHINDNDGREDLHLAVGSGIFPWEDFNAWIRSFAEKPSLLIEVRNFADLKKSVEYMKRHAIYPFGG